VFLLCRKCFWKGVGDFFSFTLYDARARTRKLYLWASPPDLSDEHPFSLGMFVISGRSFSRKPEDKDSRPEHRPISPKLMSFLAAVDTHFSPRLRLLSPLALCAPASTVALSVTLINVRPPPPPGVSSTVDSFFRLGRPFFSVLDAPPVEGLPYVSLEGCSTLSCIFPLRVTSSHLPKTSALARDEIEGSFPRLLLVFVPGPYPSRRGTQFLPLSRI